MPRYRYASVDESGQLQHGVIDALNIQAARAALRQMNVQIESIEEIQPEGQQPVAWQVTDEQAERVVKSIPVTKTSPAGSSAYYPVVDTLRLYAGWLLAWYFLIYAFGSYQSTRALPFRIPYLDDLFSSPIVLTFTFGAFLFLLLSALHRAFGRGPVKAAGLMVAGLVVLFLFRQNI